MFVPFCVRSIELNNRVVVSPMAQYRAVDGIPTDWHLVHYAVAGLLEPRAKVEIEGTAVIAD
jgi:2,4-dienoyl-CoA reductase-like NADH-dependent reductase (Old Yellow Enzyme family)